MIIYDIIYIILSDDTTPYVYGQNFDEVIKQLKINMDELLVGLNEMV